MKFLYMNLMRHWSITFFVLVAIFKYMGYSVQEFFTLVTIYGTFLLLFGGLKLWYINTMKELNIPYEQTFQSILDKKPVQHKQRAIKQIAETNMVIEQS